VCTRRPGGRGQVLAAPGNRSCAAHAHGRCGPACMCVLVCVRACMCAAGGGWKGHPATSACGTLRIPPVAPCAFHLWHPATSAWMCRCLQHKSMVLCALYQLRLAPWVSACSTSTRSGLLGRQGGCLVAQGVCAKQAWRLDSTPTHMCVTSHGTRTGVLHRRARQGHHAEAETPPGGRPHALEMLGPWPLRQPQPLRHAGRLHGLGARVCVCVYVCVCESITRF